MKPYCTQNGDYESCSLANYGKDCHNKSMGAKFKQSIYFDTSDWQEAKTLLEKREGMSEFVRTAIRNEIDRRKKESEA
jgi:hypothetical protein